MCTLDVVDVVVVVVVVAIVTVLVSRGHRVVFFVAFPGASGPPRAAPPDFSSTSACSHA